MEVAAVPFSLTITGSAEIPHHAERVRLNVNVSSTGENKASVSDDVVTTTKHIESLLKGYSPTDSSPEAQETSPLAHCSKTSLSTSSYVHHHPNSALQVRQYTATIQFDIRFNTAWCGAVFGTFTVQLTALPHVDIQNIEWMLTAATEKSFRATLRRAAAQDALTKAREYCDIFGCRNLRPVQLNEGHAAWAGHAQMPRRALASKRSSNRSTAVSQQLESAMAAQPVDAAVGDLDFDAAELKMNMEVTVTFHAE